MLKLVFNYIGCRVGRIKVIFRLPEVTLLLERNDYSHIPLAYIEWYSKLKTNSEKNSGMYKLRQLDPVEGIIVPLVNIRQGCMLHPDFGAGVESDWKSKNILDECKTFYINNWQSKYTYQTIY